MWVVLEMFTPICQKTIHECFRFLGNGASQNLAMELNKQMEILKNTPQQYFPDHHSSKKKKKFSGTFDKTTDCLSPLFIRQRDCNHMLLRNLSSCLNLGTLVERLRVGESVVLRNDR